MAEVAAEIEERDGVERDGVERDGEERDGAERDGVERDGEERDGAERDGAERIAELEAQAVRLAQGVAGTRLALGEAIEVLAGRGAHHELGFSSVAAYVIERCNRSARWIAEAQALARRLSMLSGVRERLLAGDLSWSRAELIAKLIEHGLAHQPSNDAPAPVQQRAVEAFWLHLTRGKTCLELRSMLGSLSDRFPFPEFDRSLCLTLNTEDAFWFRAAELLFRRLEGRACPDSFFECLLAETANSLVHPPRNPGEQAERARRDRWHAELTNRRERAEHHCEAHRPKRAPDPTGSPHPPSPSELASLTAPQLDGHIVALAARLGKSDLELGRLAERLHRAKAWRWLGFASEHHHARERLGLSVSSLKARRALARRLEKLPRLARALEQGQLGLVATCLVARVAKPATLCRWIERARQRTVKHLREEVAFVERVLRERADHPGWPPDPDTMRAALGLDGEIASARFFLDPDSERVQRYEQQIRQYETGNREDEADGQTSGGENRGGVGAEPGRLSTGDGLGLGRVRLRLRLRENTLLLR